MSIVTFHLPEVKYSQAERPSRCPYCAGETFQRWGGTVKRVRDPQLGKVWVCRYRCCSCRRTFRHYPVGIDRAILTQRMRALAAIGWLFGMSYRGQSCYLSGFGVVLGRMSIWRDEQQRAKQVEKEIIGSQCAWLKSTTMNWATSSATGRFWGCRCSKTGSSARS